MRSIQIREDIARRLKTHPDLIGVVDGNNLTIIRVHSNVASFGDIHEAVRKVLEEHEITLFHLIP
jgi:hypothetical protein